MANVGNNSTVIRRCTTTSVLNICLNCRKPSTFLSYCLIYLLGKYLFVLILDFVQDLFWFLDLLIPICDYYPNSLILGALSTMKTLIPNFYNNKSQETELNVITNKLLQVKLFNNIKTTEIMKILHFFRFLNCVFIICHTVIIT